ncbi:MAG: DNA-binding protein [Candidatus Omnitrophica bacterium CG12_big_fil_rev_8_21_14_0_65_50_5]|nr:MAG: DNA-binding protein [Candidatus Omnitrophica bacterium CG12_big_fil_rev_8_21_14_0_65_50_5]
MTQALIIPIETIQTKILWLRGQKVILDKDLALLYGVPTKRFNEAVRRNLERFPEDFMFQINDQEFKILRSQFATSSWGGQRYLPYAFTENGVAMLSSVLNSDRAIAVNIQIMRTFTQLRQMLASHSELKKKIEEMEKKYDGQFQIVFNTIKRLIDEPKKKKHPIGFHAR